MPSRIDKEIGNLLCHDSCEMELIVINCVERKARITPEKILGDSLLRLSSARYVLKRGTNRASLVFGIVFRKLNRF